MALTEIFHAEVNLRGLERKAELTRDLYVRTDSDSLNSTVSKESGAVQDKRLYVVIAALREAFRQLRRETLRWVPTQQMVADALTKWSDTKLLLAVVGSSASLRRVFGQARVPISSGRPGATPTAAGSTLARRVVAGAAVLSQTAKASRPEAGEEFTFFDGTLWVIAVILLVYVLLQVALQGKELLRGARALLAVSVRDACAQTEEATRREADMQTVAVMCRATHAQTDAVEQRTRAVQAASAAARTDAFVQGLLRPSPAQPQIPVPETAHPPPTVADAAPTSGSCDRVPPFVYFSRAGEKAHLFERCIGSNANMTENAAVCLHCTQRWSRGEVAATLLEPTRSAATQRGGPSIIRRRRGIG